MIGCNWAASSTMSLTSPLAPGPVGKPFTSVPVGEEIDSRICVVAPTRPILSPPSVITTAGATRPFNVFASWVSVPAPLPTVLVKRGLRSASPEKSRFEDR